MVADEINKRMSTTNPILDYVAIDDIHKICKKTVNDLKVILRELGEFQQKVVPISQNRRKKTDFFLLRQFK